MGLNKGLIKTQGLSEDDVAELNTLHETKDNVFLFMDLLDPIKENKKLRLYGRLIESVEFNMQRIWKFDQNVAYHSWWYQVPHCKCPKMDNADPMYPYKIINNNCPIHGEIK